MVNIANLSAINLMETVIRMFAYLSVVAVCFKGVQALNIYINKNSRQ
ncbi:MAG: hypothetical protein K0R54_3803 [Clostridiaceae bacterium]|jgi:hypothetical protein|nr:hypothetical protein [Clostridiaceae bacterium]